MNAAECFLGARSITLYEVRGARAGLGLPIGLAGAASELATAIAGPGGYASCGESYRARMAWECRWINFIDSP